MLKSLWKYIKKHPVIYTLSAVLAMLSGLLGLVPNYFIQRIIDELLNKTLTYEQLNRYMWVFGGVIVLMYIINILWQRWVFTQANDYKQKIKNRAFRRILTFRQPFFHLYRSGDILTRLSSDIDAIGDAMSYGVLLIVSDAIWMVMIFAYLFVMISWQLTLLSMIPMVLFGVGVYFVGRMVDERYTASRDAVAQLNHEVLEVVEGIRVMRAYGQAHLEQARFQDKTDKVLTTANHQYLANALYSPMVRFCSSAAIIISIGMGSRLVDQGLISIGQLVAFQIYLGMFLYTVWGISDIFAVYQTGQVSYQKIQELLNTPNPVTAIEPYRHLNTIETIQFDNYTFSYDTDKDSILKEIQLTIKKGQTLGIVGKTGSGKTSLIMQLLRQYPVSDQGQLLINGYPITDYPIEEIESLIAYVPQDHLLFSKSVQDNIYFGNRHASQEDYQRSIEAASFSQDIHRMAQGDQTLIGEKGVSISGGQKQRISLSRAFMKKADVLILDDSLSAVDAKTEREIIDQIQELRKDRTNIIITHRLSAVMHADDIIVIEDGRIIQEGTAQALLKEDGWFKQQYHQQRLEG